MSNETLMRLLPLLALSLAACTATGAQRAATADRAAERAAGLERELAGLTRGDTTDCLPLNNAQSRTEAYGETVVYVFSRGLKYVSRTTGGCENVGRDVLVTRTTIGRTCRGDIARTFDPVSRVPSGSCAFGDFTEYRAP